MDIFLSWSGAAGRRVALALRGLLRELPGTDAFVAEADVLSGSDWRQTIAERLSRCDAAIICLTADGMDRPWLLFEAGAVAGRGASRVVPYLVHVAPNDVPGPLQAFQWRCATEEDTRRMLAELAPGVELDAAFERQWPALERALAEVQGTATAGSRAGWVATLRESGVTHVWRHRADATAMMLSDIETARSVVRMVSRVYLSELVKRTGELADALATAARGLEAGSPPLRVSTCASDPDDAALMEAQHALEDPDHLRWRSASEYAEVHVRRVSRAFVERAVSRAQEMVGGDGSIEVEHAVFRGAVCPFSMLTVDDRVLYVGVYTAGTTDPAYGSFGPCLRFEGGSGRLLRGFQDDLTWLLGRSHPVPRGA